MARLWPFAKIPSTGSHERLHQGPQSDPLGFPQITVLAKSDVIDCKPNMVVLLEVVCEHGRATIIPFLIIVERKLRMTQTVSNPAVHWWKSCEVWTL